MTTDEPMGCLRWNLGAKCNQLLIGDLCPCNTHHRAFVVLLERFSEAVFETGDAH
jgi:hypothetical protein